MHFLILLSALVACAAGVSFNTTNSARDGGILDGPAQILRYPHQVAILYYNSLICGGSIISRTTVVTAAYCVYWVNTNHITVRAGSTHLTADGSTHQVIKSYIHGSYNPSNGDYDVAVLQVDPPFIYSDRVGNITLDDSEVPDGNVFVLTGWGSARMRVPINTGLLEAIVEIRDKETCHNPDSGEFTDRMICTGNPCEGRGSSVVRCLLY